MERVVVDLRTGEVMKILQDGDSSMKKNSIEYLDNFDTWEKENCYKANIDELKKVTKELTVREAGVLMKISPYVSYIDCMLMHPDGKEINLDSLSTITGVSRATVARIMESLIKKDIIYKGRKSRNVIYLVNPWLFVKGDYVNKVLKTMFKNYKIRVLNKKWKDL
ncbi:hypothetical protein SAMN02745751_01268 [Dethiosulfatibacter aminovorans DSM 17477]|uniref:Uncharacterized protein n=1 Tax=Dethiosulfatibacter aminovorans DSM 17477 TaxID=1121476 RepID=A0A1M6EP12_9FIRM|nr:hypothetical protein [Dethiosulfatibacter aminovorans]SHI87234.1 hypothetical protein SAMN02745751_01268 [Dethiosulfatibacter aminovorans DSM 17477]